MRFIHVLIHSMLPSAVAGMSVACGGDAAARAR
jgi:hypothetical protein